LLDQASFDLVIASMTLPRMNGLNLLRATMVRHPQTVRVLLLDQPEPALMLSTAGIAHQYLVKPCATDDLLTTVCRMLALDQFFTSDLLRRVVTRIQQLPSPPTIYFRLMQELARPEATTESVGRIIAQDASLTAKLLQLLDTDCSDYWHTHYHFGKPSAPKSKHMGEASAISLVINTVVPFIFALGRQKDDQPMKDKALQLLQDLPGELNSITKKWTSLGMDNTTAANSQALIELKNNYCDFKKCLNCRIGNALIRK